MELAKVMRYKESNLPIKYLGMLLGTNFRDKLTWEPVLSKMQHQLAGWKRSLLSKEGRLTLIKSILSNLSIYYLSILTIPFSIAKQLEAMENRFLCVIWKKKGSITWWLGRSEVVGKPWVLGIRSLEEFN